MSGTKIGEGQKMHALTIDIRNTLVTPLIALSWLSVCLLVAGTGLVVFVRRIFQISRHALLQIMRA